MVHGVLGLFMLATSPSEKKDYDDVTYPRIYHLGLFERALECNSSSSTTRLLARGEYRHLD